jgi:hypothetical protein
VPRADRLGRRDRDVDLGEAFPFEAGGECDQARVVAHRQGGDRGGVDTAGQEGADGDVGAHVLGDGILEHRGDLVVAALLTARAEGLRGKLRREVADHLGRLSWPHARVAAGFQPPDAAVQRFRFRHVLQHRVVLHGAIVDAEIDADVLRQVEQALLLAADGRPAGPRRHEQWLDAERVTRAEQFLLDGVPQCESEHAAQPGQRSGAPVVVGGDDGLTVTVGGEHGVVVGRQLIAQFEVVVDLAVEHQHVAVRRFGRAPAQRLMAVRDVDDRQPVEAEHDMVVGPGARLVGTAVAHEM